MAKSILIVDDSGTVRQTFTMSLRAAGYQVAEAVDGQDGLDKCKMQTFDLIFVDQNMPRMDGFSMLRSVRQVASYQRIPMLMLMDAASDDARAKGQAAGMNGWLVKPIDAQQMVAITKKIIG